MSDRTPRGPAGGALQTAWVMADGLSEDNWLASMLYISQFFRWVSGRSDYPDRPAEVTALQELALCVFHKLTVDWPARQQTGYVSNDVFFYSLLLDLKSHLTDPEDRRRTDKLRATIRCKIGTSEHD